MAARVVKRGKTPNMVLDESTPEKKVAVKVIDRWSVVHDDQRYVKGETVTVPESIVQEWTSSGYVERVTGKT